MSAAIVVKEGPLAGQRVELHGEIVIGREGVELTIDDSEISRRHAVVRLVGDAIEVEDLRSLNGTFVNGRRIETAMRIGVGDTVRIGRSILEIEAATTTATVLATSTPPPARVQPAATVRSDALSQPFGTYAAPSVSRRRGRIASRQLLPMLTSWAVVVATAVVLALYFAKH